MARTSYLFPLYRSARFFDTLTANIEAALDRDVEIVVSDRHGEDDCPARLRQRYGSRIAILESDDRGDWVDNINALLAASATRFVRVVPHDDIDPPGALAALERALENDTQAVAAYGPVIAEDLDGGRLPDRDQNHPNEDPAAAQWRLADPLPLFWTGRFNGAFKGLFRGDVIRARQLFVRKTPGLMHSERAWLFGFGLAGRFAFIEEPMLIKRYHATSTHAGWRLTAAALLDTARTMADYATACGAPADIVRHARHDLFHNAWRRVRALEGEGRPPYRTFPSRDADRLNATAITLLSETETAFGSGG